MEEFFPIKFKNKYVIFFPKKFVKILCNENDKKNLIAIQKSKKHSDTLKKTRIYRALKDNDLLIKEENKDIDFMKDESNFKPTSITLALSKNCNFKCIYCFANGGEKITKPMSFELAKKGIDYVINNAKDEKKMAVLYFYGFGEPTFEWELMKKITGYFQEGCKKSGVRKKVSIQTNGFLNDVQRKWFLENVDRVILSFDVLPELQNIQRPTKNGTETFERVSETAKFFDINKMKYDIRVTVTEEGIKRMKKMIKFIKKEFMNCNSVVLEPMKSNERTEKNKIEDAEYVFLKKIFDIYLFCVKNGIELSSSVIIKNIVSRYCCDALKGDIILMPDGTISSCTETLDRNVQGFDIFNIGKYDFEKNKFQFNLKKINYLRKRTVDNIAECSECFLKYSCGGGCPHYTYEITNDIFKPDLRYCELKRDLNRKILIESMKYDKKRKYE